METGGMAFYRRLKRPVHALFVSVTLLKSDYHTIFLCSFCLISVLVFIVRNYAFVFLQLPSENHT